MPMFGFPTSVYLSLLCCVLAMGDAYGAEGKLLFKSSFAPETQVTPDMLRLSGIDAAAGFDWDRLGGWVESSKFVYIVSREKDPRAFMHSEIVEMPGPDGAPAKVLHMQNKGDDPDHRSTSRNEYSLFSKKKPEDYKMGYVRYWMKLQANLDQIIPLEKDAGFYMIMEWKEPPSGNIGRTGGTNNYRINIGIDKDAGSSALYWVINAQEVQPERKTEWTVKNRDVAVPLGEWFQVEAYMKKDAEDGRVFFAVNGETVIDKTCRTQHKDNPLPLQFWSIFKLYHGQDWLRLGPTNNWYTHLELWTDFPPGVTHVGD